MEVGSDPAGNITRVNNAIASLPKALETAEQTLQSLQEKVESAKAELLRPFPQETELAEKLARLHEVDALLDMDEKGKDAPVQDTAVADRPRAATRMYADQPSASLFWKNAESAAKQRWLAIRLRLLPA